MSDIGERRRRCTRPPRGGRTQGIRLYHRTATCLPDQFQLEAPQR